MIQQRKKDYAKIGIYAILIVQTVLALFPILLTLGNSLKKRTSIFNHPFAPPVGSHFSLDGYETVLVRSDFPQYFFNSLSVTLVAILLILLLGAMSAWALSEYQFVGNGLIGIYMALGIMIPIRIGTIIILKEAVFLGLTNTLIILILVYTAQGLPLTIFILQQFFRQVPRDIKDAARIDGAGEYRIFFLVLPVVRPAMATVAVFTMVPIWNDLWFPLILSPQTPTLILGAQQFMGQYLTNWNTVLASLSLTMIPAVGLYMIFSKQLLQGITAGSVKS